MKPRMIRGRIVIQSLTPSEFVKLVEDKLNEGMAISRIMTNVFCTESGAPAYWVLFREYLAAAGYRIVQDGYGKSHLEPIRPIEQIEQIEQIKEANHVGTN